MTTEADQCHLPRWRQVATHLGAAWDPRPALQALVPSAARAKCGRLAPLDGSRAIALLWVLWFHVIVGPCMEGSGVKAKGAGDVSAAALAPADASIASRWLGSWATQPLLNGDMGVDIFFCLSGFLIAWIYVSEVDRTGGFRPHRFLLRRFLRIWPMLAVALGVFALGSRLTGDKESTEACNRDWWKVLLLLNDFMPTRDCLYLSWSVSVEFHFYLVSPLVMWAAYCPRRAGPRRYGLLFLAACSLVPPIVLAAVMAAAGPDPFYVDRGWLYSLPICRCGPYFAGMLACLVVCRTRREQHQLPSHAVVLAGVAPPTGAVVKAMSVRATTAACLDSCGDVATECTDSSKCDTMPVECANYPGPAGEAPQPQHVHMPPGQWQHNWLTTALDLLAVAVVCCLAFCGPGTNRLMAATAPAFDQALCVVGRWVFGWAVAQVFMAVLLGRLGAINALLTWRAFVPVATLSYSAYLLQKVALAPLPSWAATGVVTMWAAWGTALLACLLATLAALLVALPAHLLVERPFSLLCPR